MSFFKALNIRMLVALAAILFAFFAVLFDVLHTPARAEATDLPSAPNSAVEAIANRRSSYVPPPNEVLKKLSPAIVKISLKKFGVPVSVGAGFFANKTGLLITSRSLMRAAIADPTLAAEFQTADKKTLRDYKVVTCELFKGHDLCALKLNYDSKIVMPFSDALLEEGQGANVIGHPHGSDYSITAGTISRISKAKETSQMELEIQVALAVGNAGGPVVNDQGKLIGVVGKTSDDHPDRHVITPTAEVRKLLELTEMPRSLTDARKQSQDQLRSEMRTRAVDELDPALGFAGRGKNLAGLKGLKEVSLKFDSRVLRLTIPDIFDNCGFSQKTRESTMHACYAFGDAAVLSVQRFPNKGYEDLLSKNGKRLMEPRPIAAVETLTREEEWDMYEPVLTAQQKKAFYSEASLAQCQTTKDSSYEGAALAGVPACRFTVSNDSESGGYSVNIWLLKDQYLYAVAMWMNDANMAEYFSRVPILSVLTAKWEKPLDPKQSLQKTATAGEGLGTKPLPTYRIRLPETLSFMGAQVERGGTQLDLYGKKLLLDRFEEGFIVAVTSQNKAYLPPDFDDISRSTALKISRALGATLQPKTIETEGISVAGRPARLLTAFGRDTKGRDVLVLSGAIFFEDQTFEVTQVSVTKDSSETFREFKTLLSGFKRK